MVCFAKNKLFIYCGSDPAILILVSSPTFTLIYILCRPFKFSESYTKTDLFLKQLCYIDTVGNNNAVVCNMSKNIKFALTLKSTQLAEYPRQAFETRLVLFKIN